MNYSTSASSRSFTRRRRSSSSLITTRKQQTVCLVALVFFLALSFFLSFRMAFDLPQANDEEHGPNQLQDESIMKMARLSGETRKQMRHNIKKQDSIPSKESNDLLILGRDTHENNKHKQYLLSSRFTRNGNGNDPHNPHFKKNNRIAMVIPYLSSSSSSFDILPSYIPIFFRTAGGTADLIDFLIFHEGQITSSVLLPYRHLIPDNVKFIDLKEQSVTLASLFVKVSDLYRDRDLREGDDDDIEIKLEHLEKLINSMIHTFPYALIEYKPALGYIFESYLVNYTHWGYTDLDIAFGDVSRWVTLDELEEYDVVTYSFGDQSRAYIRGQFTFHKNNNKINQLWRPCDYLTKIHHRLKERVRLESAEGCYSSAVLQHKDIKVKYAVKAFTDVGDKKNYANSPYKYGIFISIGKYGRIVIYKASVNSGDEEQLLNLPLNWFDDETINSSASNSYLSDKPIQYEIGERIPVGTYRDDVNKQNSTCMNWAPAQYQGDICLLGDVSHHDTILWLDGKLYKQTYKMMDLPNNISSAAFFHMQNRKKMFRYGTPLMALNVIVGHGPSADNIMGGYILLRDSILPVPSLLSTDVNLKNQLEEWKMRWNLMHLPTNRIYPLPKENFCLQPNLKKGKKRNTIGCKRSVSWDEDTIIMDTTTGYIHIKSEGKGHPESKNERQLWEHIDHEVDLTLVLTIQLFKNQVTNDEILEEILSVIEANISSWGPENPCVLLIHAHDELDLQLVQDRLGFVDYYENDDAYEHAHFHNLLIGIILTEDDDEVSRKAMMDMASAACPTRWMISGLELERGLIISSEARLFASRAAHVYGDVPGNIFIIPQFGATESITHKEIDEDEKMIFSVFDLIKSGKSDPPKFTSNLASLDCNSCENTIEQKHENVENQIDQMWWELTSSEIGTLQHAKQTDDIGESSEHNKDDTDESLEFSPMGEDYIDVLAQVLSGIQLEFTGLLKESKYERLAGFDKSPILMVDTLSPLHGLLTADIVREVDVFGGLRCMNALYLSQLATIGYRIRPLSGAFALSTHDSRDAMCHDRSRCDGCSMVTNEEMLKGIAGEEALRVTKTVLLQHDLSLSQPKVYI